MQIVNRFKLTTREFNPQKQKANLICQINQKERHQRSSGACDCILID